MTFLIHRSANELIDNSDYEAVAQDLPRINALELIGDAVEGLPEFRFTNVTSGPATARALMLLSFLAHSYIWSLPEGRNRIPSKIAVPWVRLAGRSGLPPVLTYSSYVLDNCYPGCSSTPIPMFSFTGSVDEYWFIRVHQRIEEAGAGVHTVALERSRSKQRSEDAAAQDALVIATSIESMCTEANRMSVHCDPYIYYHRLRRFLHGWKWNPAFKGRAMEYVGVAQTLPADGQYSGESGAQSPLLPLIDRLLGIQHSDPFLSYSRAMRAYMYPEHRRLVESVYSPVCTPGIPRSRSKLLLDEYKRALAALIEFRGIHLKFANDYILAQESQSQKDNSEMGTGGSTILSVLGGARQAVEEQLQRA